MLSVIILVLFAYFLNPLPIKVKFIGFKERFRRWPFETIMPFYFSLQV
jgi:hypothetical protein